MRLKRPRLQFGMELHPDEPGMVLIFDDLGQYAVGRKAGETQSVLLQPILVGGIDLVAVTVAFRNLGGAAIDTGDPAPALEGSGIGAKPHRSAEITVP